jgi:hypothetical protein
VTIARRIGEGRRRREIKNDRSGTSNHNEKDGKMTTGRKILIGALTISALSCVGVAMAQYGGGYQQPGQYPLLDKAENRVIEKYRNSSCDQLWQDRYQPKSEEQQRAVNFLRSDPQIRQMFIDRVAAPVANKLFECGLIP